MDRDLLELIEELTACPDADADACWGAFLTRVRTLGLPLAQYGFGRVSPDGAVEEATIFSTLPQGYVDHYAANEQVKHDHLMAHAFQSDAPARWYDPIVQRTLSPQALRVERDAYAFGMRAGIMYPIRELGGRVIGALSFAAETGREKEFEAILDRHHAHLHLSGLLLHNEIRRRKLAKAPAILTPRERERLLWTATGLTSKEIALKLNTLQKSVENQIDSPKQKLGARNRTHAVIKAIALWIVN